VWSLSLRVAGVNFQRSGYPASGEHRTFRGALPEAYARLEFGIVAKDLDEVDAAEEVLRGMSSLSKEATEA
jgi:hypothetical protein